MTRAFNIEGLVRLQNYMVVTKGSKQLNVTTTEIGRAITPGSITSEMLADKAVTRKKLDDAAVGSEALGNASVTSVKINVGAVTSSKLAPGLDVSGLFFILPKDTQFPYTLTKGDKAKLENARFLVCVGGNGSISVALHPAGKSYVGSWLGIYSTSRFAFIGVTESVINAPSSTPLHDFNSVRFSSSQTLTAAQKLQARTNIGAAEDPNTSGDSQATLEEPPVADEEPIP